MVIEYMKVLNLSEISLSIITISLIYDNIYCNKIMCFPIHPISPAFCIIVLNLHFQISRQDLE